MLRLRRAKTEKEYDASDDEAAVEPLPEAALVVLGPDACGPAARRMHRFGDADAAVDFVRFWFPAQHRAGLIAFWALSRPAESEECDAVVLVRDGRDPAVVYPFSFLSMSEALAFVRDEMRLGLDPARVVLYFAAPAYVLTHRDAIAIAPGVPPAMVALPAVTRPAFAPPPPTATPAVSAAPPALPDDLVDRVLGVLRNRRWSEAPPARAFQGFGSPPGRF